MHTNDTATLRVIGRLRGQSHLRNCARRIHPKIHLGNNARHILEAKKRPARDDATRATDISRCDFTHPAGVGEEECKRSRLHSLEQIHGNPGRGTAAAMARCVEMLPLVRVLERRVCGLGFERIAKMSEVLQCHVSEPNDGFNVKSNTKREPQTFDQE